MGVTAGKEFAYAKKLTWVFETGVGDAFAVATHKNLVIFPYDVMRGTGRTITDTTTTIGDRHPTIAVEQVLADPATTVDQLDQTLERWCGEAAGAICTPMYEYKRIKIRTGWLTRSVVLSKKESGVVHGPSNVASIRPSKAELPAWVSFFEGDSRVVSKK